MRSKTIPLNYIDIEVSDPIWIPLPCQELSSGDLVVYDDGDTFALGVIITPYLIEIGEFKGIYNRELSYNVKLIQKEAFV